MWWKLNSDYWNYHWTYMLITLFMSDGQVSHGRCLLNYKHDLPRNIYPILVILQEKNTTQKEQQKLIISNKSHVYCFTVPTIHTLSTHHFGSSRQSAVMYLLAFLVLALATQTTSMGREFFSGLNLQLFFH